MSLRDAPLLYLFLEAHTLARQRAFLESEAGLPVIEVETNPANRHGVVKYDAGSLVISLNLSPPGRFAPSTSDGLTTVFARGHIPRTDPHGHHYLLGGDPEVAELRLQVADLDTSVRFYRDVLGLRPLRIAGGTAMFATGSVPITLTEGGSATDGRAIRYDTYLLVFHSLDIAAIHTALAARGLAYTGRGIGSKQIGWTSRFIDPSGHRFCLYQPSEEVLTWPSGPTVRRILGGQSTRSATS